MNVLVSILSDQTIPKVFIIILKILQKTFSTYR